MAVSLDHQKDAVLREAARVGAEMPAANMLAGAGAGEGRPGQGHRPATASARPESAQREQRVLAFLRT
jgi:hypothetical protein